MRTEKRTELNYGHIITYPCIPLILGVSCPDLKNIARLTGQQHTNSQNSLAENLALAPKDLPSQVRHELLGEI